MIFIDKGDASSASHAAIATQESLAELLMWLVRERKKREQEKDKDEAAEEPQEQPPEPEPVEEPDFSADDYIDGISQSVLAETAVKLVENYGQNDRYQAEGYSVKAQATVDGKAMYVVRDREHEVVAEFEKLGDRFIFSPDSLPNPAQCQEFAKASQNMKVLQEQGEDFNQNAKAQLQALGDLAPTGTKAAVVATAILDRTGLDSYSGSLAEGQDGRYEMSRDAEGALTIRDKVEGFDILLAHDGKIQAAMSAENIEHFTQLYDRLELPDQMSKQVRPGDAPPRSAEELDRQEAEVRQERPEYAPLMEMIRAVGQKETTLPNFCQELERRGVHAEVTLKEGQIEGIAYQYEGKWTPAHVLGDRYTLGGLQQSGLEVQSDRDVSILQQQGHVYRDINEPSPLHHVDSIVAPAAAAASSTAAATDVEVEAEAEIDRSVDLAVTPESATEVSPVANPSSGVDEDEVNASPLSSAASPANADLDRSNTRDRVVNVENLGGLEQNFQQADSPSIAELAEWMVAARTLGKGSDDLDHIKRIARDVTAGNPQTLGAKDLLKQQPGYKNLDYAMPPLDRQQMQADVELYRDLKRKHGEPAVHQLYEMQRASSEPIVIDQIEDFVQVREILSAQGKSGVTEIHPSSGSAARPTDFDADSKTSSRSKGHER